jgi:TRAP-type C4-dicarboxylate transport system substrate-binding protein
MLSCTCDSTGIREDDMKSLKSIAAAAAAFASMGLGPLAAQDVTLRMATAAPSKTIWQQQFDKFAADVAEETNGNVKIEIFYNSQLGPGNTVLPQVMRGRIDMGAFSTAEIADQLSDAYLVSMLHYYDDMKERTCILNAVQDDFQTLLAPTGLRLLDWAEVGSIQLSGKEAFTSPASLNGKRHGGAANPISNLYWEKQGAYPNLVSVPEAASAISTGLIDFYPTIPVLYMFAGINQVAPVLSKVDIGLPPGVIVINQRAWEGLSDDDRAGIARAQAKNPFAERSQAFYAFEAQLYAMHRANGGTVAEPTAEEAAAWREGIEDYYAEVLATATDEGRAFWGKLEAERAACAE